MCEKPGSCDLYDHPQSQVRCLKSLVRVIFVITAESSKIMVQKESSTNVNRTILVKIKLHKINS